MAPRGDFRHREAKKPKKDAKKAVVSTSVIQETPEVEVLKVKGKKTKEGEA